MPPEGQRHKVTIVTDHLHDLREPHAVVTTPVAKTPYRLYAIRPLTLLEPQWWAPPGSAHCAIVDPIPAKKGDKLLYNYDRMEIGYYRQFAGWALVQWYMRRLRRRWRKLRI